MTKIIQVLDPATRVAIDREAKVNAILDKDTSIESSQKTIVRETIKLDPTLYRDFTEGTIDARYVLDHHSRIVLAE